jgi:hypothetical protein
VNIVAYSPHENWDSEYGNVESIGGIHYIVLNNILVYNHIEGDVLATFIHELLHILNPGWEEEDVEKEEDAICEKYNIEREDTFD